MSCLRCELARMRRENAVLQEVPGAYSWSQLCDLHGSLKSELERAALLRAQARNEALDEQAIELERERRKAGYTAGASTVSRKLAFPLGRGKAPLQGEVYKPMLRPRGGR